MKFETPGLFSLQGRRVLVTGASQGIGAAIAEQFAAHGADIVIHHYNDAPCAAQVTERIRAHGIRTTSVDENLASPGAPGRIYTAATSSLGGIDILVLCASVQVPEHWTKIGSEALELQISVNFRSSVELLQLFTPPMAERNWGRVLTIGSVQERKPHPEMLVYSSLKAAQTGLGLCLARDVAARGVTINNLAPGVIDTARNHSRLADPIRLSQVISNIPMRRIGRPSDCTGLALLLCSDEGGYITGQNIFVDGGMSL